MRYLFLLLFIFTTQAAHAYRSNPIAFDAADFDPKIARVSLIVAGASNREAYMVAGHLMLRVRQPGDDYSFDWGIFDPTKKNFFIDYMRGRLNYEHIVRPFYESYRIYRFEKRSLTEYPLNLTVAQKEKLFKGLSEWAKPENRTYAYDIVFRNCSTVIGDLVASTVSEKIVDQLKKTAPTTVRASGLSYLAYVPPIEVFTDLVGGPAGDRKIEEHELFYLPVLVPEVFEPVHAYDDTGNELEQKLLGPPVLLMEGSNVGPLPVRATLHFASWMFAIGLLSWFLARSFAKARWAWTLYRNTCLVLSSFMGFVIIFLRFFANHAFAHGNSHLFFFWIIDFVLIPIYKKSKYQKFVLGYAYAHLAIAILVTICSYLIPSMYQNLRAGWSLSTPFWLLICLDQFYGKRQQ